MYPYLVKKDLLYRSCFYNENGDFLACGSSVTLKGVQNYVSEQRVDSVIALLAGNKGVSTNLVYTEDVLQSIHGLLVIIIAGTVPENPGLILVNVQFPVDTLQRLANLAHQGILKEITVLSLDTDLSVFNQKRFIHAVSPLIILSVFRIYEAPEAVLSDSPDSNPVLPLSSHCRS